MGSESKVENCSSQMNVSKITVWNFGVSGIGSGCLRLLSSSHGELGRGHWREEVLLLVGIAAPPRSNHISSNSELACLFVCFPMLNRPQLVNRQQYP